MKVLMIANDTNFAWNLRREVLKAFVDQNWQTVLVAKTLDFKTEFEELGVTLVDHNIDRRGKNLLSDYRLFTGYIQVLKKERPDIVLINNTKPNIYAGIACQILKIKYVTNITGLGTAVENDGPLQPVLIEMYKIGVRRASALFFQNSENQAFFHKHHMIHGRSKEVLLPGSGVNLDAHPVLPWPDGPLHFLFAARILKEKGIDYFISAARSFASEDIVFDVCGQCDDPSYLGILESESSIVYHGLQRDMIPLYEECSCFLYPSYYPEGMSNVLLEAAACGRPIIAADRAGCRETVDDGITGFLVPPKDEESVIRAVSKFIQMPDDERKKMGLAGREKIQREFDRNLVVQAYLDVVNSIFSSEVRDQ